uniref:Mitochondrial fission factor n=1 Tax=Romanomermis culicivorax TaxID=13658 RepID=A0A915L6J2_ROMCU
MDADVIGMAQRDVDVEFMSKVAQQMNVPRHIRLGNGDVKVSSNQNFAPSYVDGEGFSAAQNMAVPNRISIAGPDEISQPPPEIQLENRSLSQIRNAPFTLRTPPSTLTVHNGNYRTAADELEARVIEKRVKNRERFFSGSDADTEITTQNSTTIGPAGILSVDQKVLLLDKQVTRLNTRLYQLEDELETIQYWHKIMMCLSVGLIAVAALKSLFNR